MRSAQQKMMDYLAMRDHSEKELREKMSDKYSPEEVEAAINYGREKKWIAATAEQKLALSLKMAETLTRKGKGPDYINNYLRERDLPAIKTDPGDEKEKALELVKSKFKKRADLDQKEKDKITRFLLSRGFSLDTVRSIGFGNELED